MIGHSFLREQKKFVVILPVLEAECLFGAVSLAM